MVAVQQSLMGGEELTRRVFESKPLYSPDMVLPQKRANVDSGR